MYLHSAGVKSPAGSSDVSVHFKGDYHGLPPLVNGQFHPRSFQALIFFSSRTSLKHPLQLLTADFLPLPRYTRRNVLRHV